MSLNVLFCDQSLYAIVAEAPCALHHAHSVNCMPEQLTSHSCLISASIKLLLFGAITFKSVGYEQPLVGCTLFEVSKSLL